VSRVTKKEHVKMVKEIFGTITDRYDFLNHFLSLGWDILWRQAAVREMQFFKTYRLLDVACGTGDLGIEALRIYSDISVFGLDLVGEMMAKAQEKLAKKGFKGHFHLVRGDATTLPFRDESFDAVSIAFGIRNIPDRVEALKEMIRVSVPGGRIFVLEMTLPPHGFLRFINLFYLEKILPRLAAFFTKNPAAYVYLVDSIKNFPSPEVFSTQMARLGLVKVRRYALPPGITWLFIGEKPPADSASLSLSRGKGKRGSFCSKPFSLKDRGVPRAAQ